MTKNKKNIFLSFFRGKFFMHVYHYVIMIKKLKVNSGYKFEKTTVEFIEAKIY